VKLCSVIAWLGASQNNAFVGLEMNGFSGYKVTLYEVIVPPVAVPPAPKSRLMSNVK
jgi:hypothetical protein